jgi:trk system potassium uptake protein TrkH
MRIKVVIHYLGLLVTGLGLMMLLPLGWSLYHHEPVSSAFAISIAITISVGLLLWRLTPGGEHDFTRREAFMLVTLTWVLASFFGALPFQLAGTFPNYLDAYFEAMSGYTATGASALTSIEVQPQGILLWRNLMQWLGGMGIITAFIAVLPMVGAGVSRLVEAELPGPQTEKLTSRIRDTVRILWLFYVGFSLLEFLLLWQAANIPAFDALTVTFGTLATGGFCAKDLSIGGYNSLAVEIIVIVFMIIGSTNFALHYFLIWKRQLRRVFSNPEFRVYLFTLVGATVCIALNLINGMGLSTGEAFRQSGFQTVSIMATTGFSTADFNIWPAFSRGALLSLMVVGGCVGSTAGGIKVTRLIILFKDAARRISHIINPRAVIPLKVGDRVISDEVLAGVTGMSLLYLATIIVATLLMTALGLDILTSISSVIATMGTVGPGLGLVGPAANYAAIPALGKIVLIVCMLVGRLELMTVFSLLAPSFWKWR